MTKSDQNQRDASVAETLAVIDIGSNAIRMVIGQTLPDGKLEILERLWRAIRLGQDTFRTGRLGSATMRSAIAILRDYRRVLSIYGVSHIRAVATSAVREAANSDAFLDRILMATGLDVSVISVAEEGRLTVMAVRDAVGEALLTRGKTLVVEVGGGSTVLNLLDHGQIAVSQSLPTGSVRMQEVLLTSADRAEHAARLLRQQVVSAVTAFKGSLPFGSVRTFIAVGGDARWAATEAGTAPTSKGPGSLSRDVLDTLIEQCQHLTADELARAHKLPFTDAETITPALLVCQVLLASTRAKKMIVADASMRDGLLLDLAHSVSGGGGDAVDKEILRSAQSIAQKYLVDAVHAEQVRGLVLRLFDELANEHRLGPRHRLLLEVAATLHEVGTFVSTRAYHKHSYYLIEHSELLGLSQSELGVVANVARYHRRSRPKPSHPQYMMLPREQRTVVNKLAALLRIADAMDISRTQQVGDFQCRIDNNGLVITAIGGGDLTLERRSLAELGDMLQDIYGLDVHLEQTTRR